MTSDQIVTIVSAVLEGGGISVFLWFFIRGLRKKIEGLNGTIEAQTKTLEVMEQRISQTESIGELYKSMVRELPDDIEKLKRLISTVKDGQIAALEESIEQKDAIISYIRVNPPGSSERETLNKLLESEEGSIDNQYEKISSALRRFKK